MQVSAALKYRKSKQQENTEALSIQRTCASKQLLRHSSVLGNFYT